MPFHLSNPAPQDFIAKGFHHAVISTVLDGFNQQKKSDDCCSFFVVKLLIKSVRTLKSFVVSVVRVVLKDDCFNFFVSKGFGEEFAHYCAKVALVNCLFSDEKK